MNTMHILFGGFLILLFHFFNELVLKPKSLRSKLQSQNVAGPSPHFYLGNIPEIKVLMQKAHSDESEQDKDKDVSLSHRWTSTLFPHLEKWRKQYGPICLYSSGSIQWLVVTEIEMVREIIMYTSLNLGKPSYLSRDMGPLLGKGILTSSGTIWSHQRKIISPELYPDKVKGMVNLIVESTNVMLSSWETRIQNEGSVADIKIDEDLRSMSADVIARACFGSNYTEGKEIFTKLRDLQRVLSKIFAGIPGLRYLPTKNNREMWRLEKDINTKISNLIKQRLEETHEKDLLQMILEGAKNCEGSDGFSSNSISRDTFMIDNCKNIFFAGHETTAVTASWCLMLLAEHQDWQDRVRAEVLEVCGDAGPDASMLRSMKTLTMVIQETLRLYPPASFIVRTALQDVKLKGLLIPKGANIQIPIAIMQQDNELWGPDSHKFSPERFSNGVLAAGKFPQAYMPFGVGARICAGQHFAMTELKVILSLILMKFQFTISPSYNHSPAFRLVVEPGQGIILKMRKV